MTSYEIQSLIADTMHQAVSAYKKSPLPLPKTKSTMTLSLVFYFTVDLLSEELECNTQAPLLLQTNDGKLYYEPYAALTISIPFDQQYPVSDSELDQLIDNAINVSLDLEAIREGIDSTSTPY